MEITISQGQGLVPVTILHLSGMLDGTTYQTLIEKAKQVYQEGARDLLLDLAGLSYISTLLNPQPGVLRVLEVVGFTAFFEIYTDLEKAVASF